MVSGGQTEEWPQSKTRMPFTRMRCPHGVSAHDGSDGALVLIWRKAYLAGDGYAVEQHARGAGVLPTGNQEMRSAAIIAIQVPAEHDAFEMESAMVRVQLGTETTGGDLVVRFPSLRPESELAIQIGAVDGQVDIDVAILIAATFLTSEILVAPAAGGWIGELEKRFAAGLFEDAEDGNRPCFGRF